ncbi:hypothetical protein AOQ84DRAFT_257585, partial [Glonium stellatum]
FMTVDHDTHRLRRRAVDRFFSEVAVLRLESTICATMSKFCEKIEAYANSE